MPNQYTKFQAAEAQDPTSRAFTWREWTGKKQQRGRAAKRKANTATAHTTERRASNSDESTTWGASNSGTTTSLSSHSSPASSLLLYLPSGGFRIDPFRSYPVAPNHQQMAVLDHCTYLGCPRYAHRLTQLL